MKKMLFILGLVVLSAACLFAMDPRLAAVNPSTKLTKAKPVISEAPRPDPAVILQGGDNIGNATEIPSLPYTDSGTTVGYTDDYVGSCGSGGGAPDVVYSFSPVANMAINISLCNTDPSWDATLYVFENDPNTEIACNEDNCGVLPRLHNVALTGGNTYYIVVDGFWDLHGRYIIDVTEHVPSIVTCPTTATLEGEDCGTDLNGGCESPTAHLFGAINSGDTVCGTTWSDLLARDTDWYKFGFTSSQLVTYKGVAEFPLQMYIISDSGADCLNTSILGSASASEGDT